MELHCTLSVIQSRAAHYPVDTNRVEAEGDEGAPSPVKGSPVYPETGAIIIREYSWKQSLPGEVGHGHGSLKSKQRQFDVLLTVLN